jgi:methylmalonyl-CoA/ethylmalonyl-CoA epimerase
MEKSTYANPHHMAIVVRDIDKTIHFYQSLGMGPFVTPPPVNFKKRTYQGKTDNSSGAKIKEAIGNMGTVKLQLIQPIAGTSIYQDFLDTRGEGVHHYAFLVDDIEKEEASFTKQGVEILSSVRLEGGGGHIIINTAVIGGILIELMQPPAGWLKSSAEALQK